MRTHGIAGCLLAAMALGCSKDASGRRGEVGVYQPSGGGTGSAGRTGGSGPVSGAGRPASGAGAAAGNGLDVHVEDIEGLTIDVVTLQCAGDCADIEAVARGGNPPYTFEWEDGSTSAARRVCLQDDGELAIAVTDTAIERVEFEYAARTERASVRAEVVGCGTPDGGASPDAGPTDAGPTPDAGSSGSCGQGSDDACELLAATACGDPATVSLTIPTSVAADGFCLKIIRNESTWPELGLDIWASATDCTPSEWYSAYYTGASLPPPGTTVYCGEFAEPSLPKLLIQLSAGVVEDFDSLLFFACDRCNI